MGLMISCRYSLPTFFLVCRFLHCRTSSVFINADVQPWE